MRKSPYFILFLALFGLMLPLGHAATVTVEPGAAFAVSTGSLIATNEQFYNKITEYPANNTIRFDIAGLELTQHNLQDKFTVLSSGVLNIVFDTVIQSPGVNCPGVCTVQPFTASGVYKGIVITKTGPPDPPLIITWTSNLLSETPTGEVLFIDDFLYTNPLAQSQWTVDSYNSPQSSAGVSTSSGYLIMKAQAANSIEAVHVTNPSFSPSPSILNGTIIKRKLTVSLYPFTKLETPVTSDLRIGMMPLLASGAFPGNAPAGTPYEDPSNNCSPSPPSIGAVYMSIGNAKNSPVIAHVCGAGVTTTQTIANLNGTSYTVITVETYGIYCTSCTAHAYPGTSWAWFRIYQRDASGKLIAGSDNNFNVTTPVGSLYQPTYISLIQTNSNGATTGQVTKIDLVQLQNYGSPVCLNVPGGFLCTSFPRIPGNFGAGVISDFAFLSNLLGFGDPQAGAVLLFLILSGGFCFVPLILTRNYMIGGLGELIVIGFFTYAGFFPSWVIFLPILGGGVLIVLIINRLVGGHSLIGGGGGVDQ